MDYTLLAQELEAHQQLRRNSSNQAGRQAGEVVVLDKVVKIDAQQLKADAQVASEIKGLAHVHHIRQSFCR